MVEREKGAAKVQKAGDRGKGVTVKSGFGGNGESGGSGRVGGIERRAPDLREAPAIDPPVRAPPKICSYGRGEGVGAGVLPGRIPIRPYSAGIGAALGGDFRKY
jgi:hypothetical protein